MIKIVVKSLKDLKKEYKRCIKAVIVTFIVFLPILILINYKGGFLIDVLQFLYFILIGCPVYYGLRYYFLEIIRGNSPEIDDLFIAFREKRKIYKIIVKSSAVIYGSIIFFFLISFIIIVLISSAIFSDITITIKDVAYNGLSSKEASPFLIFIILTGMLAIYLTCLSYTNFSQLFNFYIDNPESSESGLILSSIEKSSKLIKTKKIKFSIVIFIFTITEILLFFTIFKVGGYLLLPLKMLIYQNFYQECYINNEG